MAKNRKPRRGGMELTLTPHEPGSAGTLAGVLPVELFAGKGAGAPGNGSWVQGFDARNVLSENSHPDRFPREREQRIARLPLAQRYRTDPAARRCHRGNALPLRCGTSRTFTILLQLYDN